MPGNALGTGDPVIKKAEKTAVLKALMLKKKNTNKEKKKKRKPYGDKFLKKVNMNDRQGCVRSY